MTAVKNYFGALHAVNWSEAGSMALKSAAASFVAATYFSGGNVAVGTMSAVVAAALVIVDEFVKPIFQYFLAFNKGGSEISLTTEFTKRTVMVILADQLLKFTMKKRIDVIASAIVNAIVVVGMYLYTKDKPWLSDNTPYFVSTAMIPIRI